MECVGRRAGALIKAIIVSPKQCCLGSLLQEVFFWTPPLLKNQHIQIPLRHSHSKDESLNSSWKCRASHFLNNLCLFVCFVVVVVVDFGAKCCRNIKNIKRKLSGLRDLFKIRDLLSNDAMAAKTSHKKRIYFLPVFIGIIPTQLLLSKVGEPLWS